ncbi:hypothetical protein SEVIR_8G134400v4 [Setaria viridis]|uniref:Uncharacterized protein n=2 Tax=Setaria TaxID=4554 RepID=A0A368S753_SETIT|nr:hypothetical protein SETIT_8G127600v2 [Setaria italica]TKW00778.1 hypothetical protein SEVIR_8G134400v2 [Setaria viridis]
MECKKPVSVLALVAAMVVLQLMAAPVAMARPMQAMEQDAGSGIPLSRQIMEEPILSKLGKRQSYCGETCYFTGCADSSWRCVQIPTIPFTTYRCMRPVVSLPA